MDRALVALLALLGAAADPRPAEVLERARDLIRENAGHITRYSCLQTIRRESRRHRDPLWEKVDCAGILAARAAGKGPALQPASWDRMRLDVILSEGTETHSWPQGGPIDPGVMELMTARGSFGTGDFAAFPISILASDAAEIRFDRVVDAGTLAYRYRVPRERSRYALDTGSRHEVTGYSGELWIDAATARLVRLTVATDVLPRATGFCTATTLVEFNRETPASIPRNTRIDAVTALGYEDANTIEYAGCRVFSAESSIRFDMPATSGDGGASAKLGVPAGITVRLRLESTIDSANAAAGDAVTFTLRSALKRGGVTVAAAGARVHGRIVHLEHEAMPQRGYWLLLVFDSVDVEGQRRPIRLRPPVARMPELGRLPTVPLGTEGPLEVGRFWFANMDPLVVKAGWETMWETW